MKKALLSLIILLVGSTLYAESPSVAFSIPRLTDAPTIDGLVQSREWTGASILPPLIDQASNGVRGQQTRIYFGWNDVSLFVAIQHRPPRSTSLTETSAENAGDLKVGDHLELAMSGKSTGASLILWPGKIFFVSADQPVAQAWTGKIHNDETGWEAEIQVPLATLGIDPKALTPLHLEATLNRPSFGLPPNRLSADLRLDARSVAVRFLEGGVFVGGGSQGTRVEIVNAGTDDLTCAAKLTFTTPSSPPQLFDEPKLHLPPNSARRVQLAQPLTTGEYKVDYAISLDNASLATGGFGFESGGAMQVEVVPFFLWRSGIFVRATLMEAPTTQPTTNPASMNLSARLLDSSETNTVAQASGLGSRPGLTELFLSTKDIKPGVYVVEVKATDGAQTIAVQKQRITRPELPGWWKPRDGAKP